MEFSFWACHLSVCTLISRRQQIDVHTVDKLSLSTRAPAWYVAVHSRPYSSAVPCNHSESSSVHQQI